MLRVRLELILGTDPNVRDSRKRTPIFYAAKHGYPEIIELLIAEGAEIDAVDVDGRTALFLALRDRQPAAIRACLEAGASWKIKDGFGLNALEFANNQLYFVGENLLRSWIESSEKVSRETDRLAEFASTV